MKTSQISTPKAKARLTHLIKKYPSKTFFTSRMAWTTLKEIEPNVSLPAVRSFMEKLEGFYRGPDGTGEGKDKDIWRQFLSFVNDAQTYQQVPDNLKKHTQKAGEGARETIHHECGNSTLYYFSKDDLNNYDKYVKG